MGSGSASSPARLGILVGGGPAPGINGVIAAAAIEAINCGLQVVGINDGFKWLVEGDSSRHRIASATSAESTLHGLIHRASRTNPKRGQV